MQAGKFSTQDSAHLHPWVWSQIAPWVGHGVQNAEALQTALSRESTFLFRIANGVVDCDYKLTHLPFARRAQSYHEFFNRIVSKYTIPSIVFAIDVGDEAEECVNSPLFSFQKIQGSKNILLPDIDFLASDFYGNGDVWALPDLGSYAEKSQSASFVGSTTGVGHITQAMLDNHAVPRVEAARFFRDKPNVDFRLPNIVQCSEQAEQSLRDEGFGSDPLNWHDQIKSKFLISIDGNGATCSRIYIALASNSVLLKYKSLCELFYFEGLQPWKHYIPIDYHEEVLQTMQAEPMQQARFEEIALEGAAFAAEHLTREKLEAYTADLLTAYAAAL